MEWSNLGFNHPFILLALLVLPLLWWILKLSPPVPRRLVFGPFVLLKDLVEKERKPKSPPWWLLLLRLLIAALLILGLANPYLKPDGNLTAKADAKLIVLVENSGAQAARWPEVIARIQDIAELRRSGEGENYLIVSSEIGKTASKPLTSNELVDKALALEPVSYPPDRNRYLSAIEPLCSEACEVILVADGQAFTTEEEAAQAKWLTDLEGLPKIGSLSLLLPNRDSPVIREVTVTRSGVEAEVERAIGTGKLEGRAEVLAIHGQVLARVPFSLAAGQTSQKVAVDVESPIRHQAALLRLNQLRDLGTEQVPTENIQLSPSAASAAFLPGGADFWQVALISSRSEVESGRLTSPEHYLRQALAPIASVQEYPPQLTRDMITKFSRTGVSSIFILNVPDLNEETENALIAFVEQGGQVVWVAGADLGVVPPALSPVRLRPRKLERGGTFAWAKEVDFGEVRKDGPFADFIFPETATVSQQILAEPGQDTEDHSWVWASDGTPLVSGKSLGSGTLVFLHAGLDPGWTNLTQEAVFLPFIKRILSLTRSNGQSEPELSADAILPARWLLNGFSEIVKPEGISQPLTPDSPREANAATPPGLYGEGLNPEAIAYATGRGTLRPLAKEIPDGVKTYPLTEAVAQTFIGPLILAAFALMLIDGLVALAALGLLSRFFHRRQPVTALILCAFLITLPSISKAQEKHITNLTSLGFVQTGRPSVDRRSEEGLEALALALEGRTTYKASPPVAINFEAPPASLPLLPLIYWPVQGDKPALSDQALANLANYLKSGGMILFDTRDYLPATQKFTTAAKQWVVDLHERLAIPAIREAPDYHVVSRSFFILDDFQGRLGPGRLWITEDQSGVEAEDQILPRSDGLSPVLIVESDLANLWAKAKPTLEKTRGLNLSPLPSAQEWAIRAGVNIVLYALTGNYKADQVHVPKILQLIGQ